MIVLLPGTTFADTPALRGCACYESAFLLNIERIRGRIVPPTDIRRMNDGGGR
jgi:hypothetical protein